VGLSQHKLLSTLQWFSNFSKVILKLEITGNLDYSSIINYGFAYFLQQSKRKQGKVFVYQVSPIQWYCSLPISFLQGVFSSFFVAVITDEELWQ